MQQLLLNRHTIENRETAANTRVIHINWHRHRALQHIQRVILHLLHPDIQWGGCLHHRSTGSPQPATKTLVSTYYLDDKRVHA